MSASLGPHSRRAAPETMLYQQLTDTCFADAIGAHGLKRAEFKAVVDETAPTLDRLRQRYGEGGLPFLSVTGARDDLAMLEAVARRWRDSFSHVIVLGVGGSSLGGQALCALSEPGSGPHRGAPSLRFMDNVDPDSFERLFRAIDPAQAGFLVISKSGATTETLAQFAVCLGEMRKAVRKPRRARHFTVITEPGDNPLRRLAEDLSIPVLDHHPGIGGRFSVLSLVGLLPAMIAGLDAAAVRDGAASVLEAALSAEGAEACEPAVGAAINVALLRRRAITTTVLMTYADRLAPFALWFRQLWAESLGKDGTGTTPIQALGTGDQHSQLQLYLAGPRDKMFTLVTLETLGMGQPVRAEFANDPRLDYLAGRTVGDFMAIGAQATAETLVRQGRPVRLFRLARLDEQSLGGMMMHFMLETVITAGLLGVDPFDQPAVEEGKALARGHLARMSPKK